MNKLSPKQEKFVQEYIKSGNATQSYLDAGYGTKSPEVGASQLLRNIKVKERLEELKKVSTNKFIIDKEFLTEKYLEIHNLALDGNINVSKGALDSLARMYGMDTQKIDVTSKGESINIQIEKTYIESNED
jgi:phage terminase small subunit